LHDTTGFLFGMPGKRLLFTTSVHRYLFSTTTKHARRQTPNRPRHKPRNGCSYVPCSMSMLVRTSLVGDVAWNRCPRLCRSFVCSSLFVPPVIHPTPLQEKLPRISTRGTEPRRWVPRDTLARHPLLGAAHAPSTPSPRFHQSWRRVGLGGAGRPQARPSANGVIVCVRFVRFQPREAGASEHEGGPSHARVALGERCPPCTRST
jgi:hypothetical protein